LAINRTAGSEDKKAVSTDRSRSHDAIEIETSEFPRIVDKQRQSKDIDATPFDFSEKVKPDAGPMTLAIENFKPASIQILDSQIHAVMDQDRPLSGKSKSLLTPKDPRSKFLEEFSKGVFKLKRSTSSLLLASEIAQPKTPSIPNLKQSKNPNLNQSLG
jgi:hypothetical protein